MGAAEVVISGQFIPVSPSEVYEEPKRKDFCFLEQKIDSNNFIYNEN